MKLLRVAVDASGHRSGAARPAWRIRLLPTFALLYALLVVSPRAQCNQGGWEPSFDHELNTPNTNYLFVPPLWVWPSTFNSLHMALIPIGPYRGMVLAWDVADGLTLRPYQRWTIIDPNWTPGSGRLRFRNFFLPMPPGLSAADLFCAGQAWGSDGRLFVAGGTARYGTFDGSSLVYQFCPDLYDLANQDFGVWLRQPDMANTRWYPTVTVMADGAFLVSGGTNASVVRNDYEVFRIAQPGLVPPDAAVPDQRANGPDPRIYNGPTGAATFDNYPRVHLLSTGQVFSSGFNFHGVRWAHVPSSQPAYDFSSGTGNGSDLSYPTSVLDPRGGGGDDRVLRMGGLNVVGATDEVDTCVASQPGPWQSLAAPFHLAHGRWVAMGLSLPSAQVFVYGGSSDRGLRGVPVLTPELLTSSGFVDQPQHQGPRNYHTAAVLLPDGRVFVGGADIRSVDYQIYDPPYLTCGRPRPRKVGCSVPPVVGGLHYTDNDPQAAYTAWWDENLPAPVTVTKVVLMRPGCVTHHTDVEARYLELPVLAADDETMPEASIRFRGPRNSAVAPRGWYLLFLVTNEGVPAEALWVHLQ